MTGLIDTAGKPLQRAIPAQPRRVASLNGGVGGIGIPGGAAGYFPYDAAGWQSQEMGAWNPWIRSPDSEINQHRDRMVARSRDMVRNDAWAAGGVTRILDSTIGGSYRLRANPDYRALSLFDKGFDDIWADEFKETVEALWRGYADDVDRYCDVSRKLTVTQQLRLGLRHRLIDGENLSIVYWMPERVAHGGAHFATAFRVIDPDRLSNPYQAPDSKHCRGGVEIDDNGVPLSYWIRKAHQDDWYNAVDGFTWEQVAHEDDDSWRRVIHGFEMDRSDQNRGVSVFAPVLARLKMLARYYGVELQAATVASIFGTYITSPYDAAMIKQAIEDTDGQEELSFYQNMRSEWAAEHPVMMNGVRIPVMPPGETINSVAANRPHGEFSPFAHEMLRSLAAVLGVSAGQITQDYSEVNFSSARIGIVEAEKTFDRRVAEFNADTATPHYACWLHEVMDEGLAPMPRNAPSFAEFKTAFARCRWLGPGRGWMDPVTERQGAILGMDAAFSTLDRECSENEGEDYVDMLKQRARELKLMDELGIPRPDWTGGMPAESISQKPTTQKPQKPSAS